MGGKNGKASLKELRVAGGTGLWEMRWAKCSQGSLLYPRRDKSRASPGSPAGCREAGGPGVEGPLRGGHTPL